MSKKIRAVLATDGEEAVEDTGYYGKVHTGEGCQPHVALPLPSAYGLPRFDVSYPTRPQPTTRGQYVSVSGPKPIVIREDCFWRREPHVSLILGRGDGVLLHAATVPGSLTAFSTPDLDEAGVFARWPASEDDEKGDRLYIPPEWLRPIAQALLLMADHLENTE